MPGPVDVVLLLTSFAIGGTERQMVELARRLDPSRFRVHLACFHQRGRLLDDIPSRIPIREFPVRGFANPAAVGRLIAFASWCRSIDAAIVHTCDLYANIFGLPGAALAGVPVRIANRREILTGDKSPRASCGPSAWPIAPPTPWSPTRAPRAISSSAKASPPTGCG